MRIGLGIGKPWFKKQPYMACLWPRPRHHLSSHCQRNKAKPSFGTSGSSCLTEIGKMSETISYFCAKSPHDLTPCCSSIENSKSKMKSRVRETGTRIFSELTAGATKKWGESGRTSARVAPLSKTHGLLKTGSIAWRKRARPGDDDSISSALPLRVACGEFSRSFDLDSSIVMVVVAALLGPE